MNQERTELLMMERGHWFNTSDPMKSLMCFGFECGPGWFLILEDLFLKIEQVLNRYEVPEGDFEIVQVKEKWGTLRVYHRLHISNKNQHESGIDADNEIEELIDQAESNSAITCEICGEPGKTRNLGWTFTLCDECAKKDREQRIEGLHS